MQTTLTRPSHRIATRLLLRSSSASSRHTRGLASASARSSWSETFLSGAGGKRMNPTKSAAARMISPLVSVAGMHTTVRASSAHEASLSNAPPIGSPTTISTTATPSPLATLTGPWTTPHPPYTPTELHSIRVLHRPPQDTSDRLAQTMVKLARWGFDLVTGYRHKVMPIGEERSRMGLEGLRKGGYVLTPGQWLDRILFLESIAGVPGMVGGVLRHLRSLRLMRRDGGWIHTLLSEAENERMHLLTFMTIKQPTPFFRAMVLAAQGMFFNMFFLAYLVSPRTAHRFVGHLEEEACLTYTRCLEDMKDGLLPEWEGVKAPEIAIDYWHLSPDAKLIDVIYAVRADEAGHRIVNHTLANLDQKRDFNPFALRDVDVGSVGGKVELTRDEAAEYARACHEQAMAANAQQGVVNPQAVNPQA